MTLIFLFLFHFSLNILNLFFLICKAIDGIVSVDKVSCCLFLEQCLLKFFISRFMSPPPSHSVKPSVCVLYLLHVVSSIIRSHTSFVVLFSHRDVNYQLWFA